MKKTLLLPLLAIFFPMLLSAQSLDFETIINPTSNIPVGWSKSTNIKNLPLTIHADSLTKRSGKYSMLIDGKKNSQSVAMTRGRFSYEGDTVCLTGYVKADVSVGAPYITFSLFGSGGTGDNIASEVFTINGTGGEWIPFELKSALCPEVKYFAISCDVNGDGKIWLDDFELTIDGKPLSEAVQRPAQKIEYKAVADKGFEGGSGFTLPKQLSPAQVENLNALARVWGLAKYYHPAVARGDFNMDYELFRILPKVYNATADVRNKILLEWVESLGSFSMERGRPNEGVSWVGDKKRFGSKLSAKLTDLSTAKRLPFHYYFRSEYGVPNFCNEAAYTDMSYDDAGMRLLGVFRLWNAIEFFYPYRYMTDDRDKMLSEALLAMSAPEVTDKFEYLTVLHKLLYGIHDSHSLIRDPERAINKKLFTNAVPFEIDAVVEGKFVVKRYFGKSGEGNLLKGDAITHIDGQSVTEIIEKYKHLLSASNNNRSIQLVAKVLSFLTNKESETYIVDRNGTIIEVEAKAYPLKEYWTMYEETAPTPVTHKIYDDSVAYINLEISGEELKKISEEYFSYPRIIIDIRDDADDAAFDILTQLLPGTFVAAHYGYADPYRPGNFIKNKKGGDYFTGQNDRGNKVVVIVDHNTQSYMEYITMMLQTIQGTITVGSQTSGADGNCTSISLPGNVEAYFTSLDWHYPNGDRCQGVGVRIDEVVTPTLKGIREGRDELLERALEVVKRK